MGSAWEPPRAGDGPLWLLYARDPGGPPPRRWRGLVGYGRLDIAARVLLASLYPGGSRVDGLLVLFLDRGGGAGRLLVFDRGCLPDALEGERGAAELVLAALRGEACSVAEAGLDEVLRLLRRHGWALVLLREDGEPLPRTGLDWARTALILGARVDPPEGLRVDYRFRLGCRSYLASSVAAFINAVRLLRGRGDGEG